ncbi:MAG: YhdP family protein [Sideroxyarcus sp.]|nr:YhdP family protein [Sideroxyarcus sp.]
MLKPALRHTARGLKHLTRIALLFCLVVAGIGIAALLALRYWVLPDVERYHADITTAASVAFGRPVTIARIEADWSGLRPRLLLSDVKILDEQGKTALEFPYLRNTIAWTTLFAGELRFYSLELDSPELLIRRDAQGRRYVAGILSGEQSGVQSDETSADWLLHQSRIVVHNGHIVWQDELRGAPAISFSQVELVIENRGERHRFALRASPPGNLASSIDLRGDLYGTSFTEPSQWYGRLFGQLDRLDAAAWNRWFTLPDAFQSGKGAGRIWLGLADGKIDQVNADVALHDVRARLADDLPQLDMDMLSGHLDWRKSDSGFDVSTRQLSLRMRNGFELKPTDFFLSLSAEQGYRSASGEIRANALNLADINVLLGYLPVEAGVKKRITDLAPQGRVHELQASWQGDKSRLARYRVSARFEGIGVRQVGSQPGFSGLSGRVDGGDSDGTLQLDSFGLKVQAPDFLSEHLLFDSLKARLDWQRNGQGWDLKLNNAQIRNADFEGTIYGGYQMNDGPGVADISINLARVSVKHAARYIPVRAFNEATYRWLQTGLQDGVADTFQMRVRGDLRNFPFPDNKNGLFKIEAKAKNVAIEFDPGWPRIEQAAAKLLIHGRRLEVSASTAMTAGAALQNVSVALPDTLAKELVMQVRGEAADATQRCLDYIRQSPVRGYLDGYTDDFKARGDGLLKLQLDIPLSGSAPTKVTGSYRFADNQVDLGEHVPLLNNVDGDLSFSNEALQATDIKAQILGGPARISLHSENGVLLTQASGKLNADNLAANYDYPLLRRLHGTADWAAVISVKDKLADVVLTSDLHGLISDLPQPFTKAAEERIQMRFEQKDISTQQDMLRFSYGEVISADLRRTATEQGGWEIKRGAIVFGKEAGKASKDGIWLSGDLPQFALEGWSGWSDLPNREGVLPNIADINITVDKIYGFGNSVHQLNIRGSGRNGLISTRLSSRELNGDLIWQPQDEGRLLVRLKNAMLGEGAGEITQAQAAPAIAVENKTARLSLPALDLAIDKLTWKGRQLGKLEILTNSTEGDVVLERLRLTNPDGVFNASGRWTTAPEQTYLNARIAITNAGRILARSNYPESLRDGSGTLECDLVWNGAPDEFNYASLNGTLRLKTGKGRFLQVNPGAAKLLGVLSLQSLPKRISLDFTDVFSPGFEFDSIAGDAVIENGLLKATDFKMTGAAAKVTLNGQVDLERETQQLQVRVMPTIGDNVSLLSFAAGPVVGVSVLLANKLLRDPLDKLVSFVYNVSGSWADPKVERLGQLKPSPEISIPVDK